MGVKVEKIASLTGHNDSIYSIVSDDNTHIFSTSGDGMVVKWNLSSPDEGELVAKLPNSIYAIHKVSDTTLLVGNNYEGIHLLDWQSKKEIASLILTDSYIFDIKSVGNDLIIACGNGSVIIADLHKWNVKDRVESSDKSARTIAVNYKAGHLAVGYSDNHIRIYSLNDFSLIHQFIAHANSVFALHYTPDYKFLISGSRDARLKVWDVTSGYIQAEEVVAHLFAINTISFSPSGDHFATGSMDKTIKIWDTKEIKLLKVIDKARHKGHGSSVNKLLWTSFNNHLVSASDDRMLSVWNLEFE
jgi:WD40 repeat protein